ncbi:hypothetical protein FS749_001513 [Ceratobasidium sp. UAMH 11750]|nr:hypothetical protein FS749_001513 [Ceratobasidium sp. UAMH 11750]
MLPLVISLLVELSLATACSLYDVSKAEWDALNSTVGGRLGLGDPLAQACFAQAGVNMTAGAMDCATIQTIYSIQSYPIWSHDEDPMRDMPKAEPWLPSRLEQAHQRV